MQGRRTEGRQGREGEVTADDVLVSLFCDRCHRQMDQAGQHYRCPECACAVTRVLVLREQRGSDDGRGQPGTSNRGLDGQGDSL